jgi:hypothetical protein
MISTAREIFGNMALVLLLASGAAHSFNIFPDTVDLRSNPQYNETEFIVNATEDSLVIDSVSLRPITEGPSHAQLEFELRNGEWPNIVVSAYYTFGYSVDDQGNAHVGDSPFNPRVSIPPFTPVSLLVSGFDYCVNACPLVKPSAVNFAPGDTLRAMVTFHAGSERDSVLFLSIARFSGSIVPFSDRNFSPDRADYFDPLGRRLSHPGRHPTVIPVPRR